MELRMTAKIQDKIEQKLYSHDPKFMTDNLKEVAGALRLFAWNHPFEATLCLGWIVSSPLSGMLPWRAHLAITAEAGSGKTTLLNKIADLLREWGPLVLESATEAGLRQKIKNDAIPVILDELDTNSHDDRTFQNIIKLFRIASTGGEVIKGTPTGKALIFRANFSGLIAGINLPKFSQADETRFCVLELNSRNRKSQWFELEREINKAFSSESATDILNWTINNPGYILQSIHHIRPLIEEISDARTAQQYGVLLGAAQSFLQVPAPKLLEELKDYWKYKAGHSDNVVHLAEKDSERCLEHLMSLIVGVDESGRKFNLSSLIHEDPGAIDTKNKFIAIFGLKLQDNALFVAGNNPELKKHFNDTPWLSWSASLRRLESTKVGTCRVSGVVRKGVFVKIQLKQEIL